MNKLHKYIDFRQIGGKGNLVNAESKEVFKSPDGQIKKVNNQAPTHDDGVLINEEGQAQSATYNNGGVVIPAQSVLSATHENRDSGDKSYGILDEAIKVKPTELDDYALSLGLKKIKSKSSVSPSKAFELLKDKRDKEADKFLKFKTHSFSDDYSKASEQANMTMANQLVKDEDLYDYLFQIQELKKNIINKK